MFVTQLTAKDIIFYKRRLYWLAEKNYKIMLDGDSFSKSWKQKKLKK
jgi:hypothetical protein